MDKEVGLYSCMKPVDVQSQAGRKLFILATRMLLGGRYDNRDELEDTSRQQFAFFAIRLHSLDQITNISA